MKVYVNFPDNAEDKSELEDRLSVFRANLIIKKIEELNISNTSKSKLLNQILENFESKN